MKFRIVKANAKSKIHFRVDKQVKLFGIHLYWDRKIGRFDSIKTPLMFTDYDDAQDWILVLKAINEDYKKRKHEVSMKEISIVHM